MFRHVVPFILMVCLASAQAMKETPKNPIRTTTYRLFTYQILGFRELSLLFYIFLLNSMIFKDRQVDPEA